MRHAPDQWWVVLLCTLAAWVGFRVAWTMCDVLQQSDRDFGFGGTDGDVMAFVRDPRHVFQLHEQSVMKTIHPNTLEKVRLVWILEWKQRETQSTQAHDVLKDIRSFALTLDEELVSVWGSFAGREALRVDVWISGLEDHDESMRTAVVDAFGQTPVALSFTTRVDATHPAWNWPSYVAHFMVMQTFAGDAYGSGQDSLQALRHAREWLRSSCKGSESLLAVVLNHQKDSRLSCHLLDPSEGGFEYKADGILSSIGDEELRIWYPVSRTLWQNFRSWAVLRKHRHQKPASALASFVADARVSVLAVSGPNGCIAEAGSSNISCPIKLVSSGITGSDGCLGGSKCMLDESTRLKLMSYAAQNENVLTLTVVTAPFLPFAHSWLCNVDFLGIRPPGIVWLTQDAKSAAALSLRATNFHSDFLTLDLSEMHGAAGNHAKGDASGLPYGSEDYWRLMLARSILLAELAFLGADIFLFETDALWTSNALGYATFARRVGADVVGALDTRKEIGGNFLFIRNNLNTKRLMHQVASEFFKTFQDAYKDRSRKKQQRHRYLPNDQSTITRLALFTPSVREHDPVSFFALDSRSIADGVWYNSSKPGRIPDPRFTLLINNNFIKGVDAKVARAKLFSHWFWDERTNSCNQTALSRSLQVVTPAATSDRAFAEQLNRHCRAETR
ncbi:hypothetical protein FVE85_5351 [Porphyridium purpureum]|uniref:Nucleotide-diphospho-sugar transferase domain-containing protein n=1 Tax=Porphyridium purpureum TaxID=35688 RepID=A0A5J4Z2B8_PORPP|nr:hypothetical protein FVE85_5351 [Porphyridium purpureum]|eukprot:POR1718..scf295_1